MPVSITASLILLPPLSSSQDFKYGSGVFTHHVFLKEGPQADYSNISLFPVHPLPTIDGASAEGLQPNRTLRVTASAHPRGCDLIPRDEREEECLYSLQTTWQPARGKRPLRGEFKLKLHGGRTYQISSEAHKTAVTENKHFSRRKMEKVRKRHFSKPGRDWVGGRGEGLSQGPRASKAPQLFGPGVWEETGPTSISSNWGGQSSLVPSPSMKAWPAGNEREMGRVV